MNKKANTQRGTMKQKEISQSDIKRYVVYIDRLAGEYNAARDVIRSKSSGSELYCKPLTRNSLKVKIPENMQILKFQIREIGWRLMAGYGFKGMQDVCYACSGRASLCIDRRWNGIGNGTEIWMS